MIGHHLFSLAIMDSMMTNDKAPTSGLPGWQLVPRFLLWLGGSTGVIGVVLSVFGLLIEHGLFDRLGIPRTLYEATPDAYLVTGGKFLLFIVPLALTGSLFFIQCYWWLVLGTILMSALLWWKSCSSRVRWLIAAGCMALALILLALRFENHQAPDHEGVTMFIFVVVVGITYSYIEGLFLPDSKFAEQGMSSLGTRYGVRVPFFVFLLCALVPLPYLWGYYGLMREYPLVQFLAKDQAFFCDILVKQNPWEQLTCDQEVWRVINLGKERAILQRDVGSRIYVVPAASLTTFSIFGKDQKP
jgi:hypothetical protein